MERHSMVSVVIAHHGDHKRLPRLLQSLARQDIGQNRLDLALVTDHGDEASMDTARRWRHILGCARFLILPHAPASLAAGLDQAARMTDGDAILFMDSLCRLSPACIASCTLALQERPEADVVYPNALDPLGLRALSRFSHLRLKRTNAVGSLGLLRRRAFHATSGLRANTGHVLWDLWIQAAQAGARFHHLPHALYSREATPLHPGGDARDKAMLVLNNPAYFHARVLRWALGVLRSEPWAEGFDHGRVPDARAVKRMVERHVAEVRHLPELARTAEDTRHAAEDEGRDRLDRARRLVGLAS